GLMTLDQEVVGALIGQYGSLEVWLQQIEQEPQDVGVEWLAVMRRYHGDGTVFASAHRGALYAVRDMDDTGCVVDRLTANEPERCTVSNFVSKFQAVRGRGGQAPLSSEWHSTAAVRTAYLQSPRLAASSDRSTVCFVASDREAATLLCEYVEKLN